MWLFDSGPVQVLYTVVALIIGITFHEFAHAWVADRLGDSTPRYTGRLSLNPLKHLDPLGLLMLLIVQFGWAKPVQVNPANFRGDRRWGFAFVSLAGPMMNFLLAFLAVLVIFVGRGALAPAQELLSTIFGYNIWLGAFNLLPIPPLDGMHAIYGFLSYEARAAMDQIGQFGWIIILILIRLGVTDVFLNPLANGIANLITHVAAAVAGI